MLRLAVLDALKINNTLSIACKKIEDGEVTIGSYLSDGIRQYEIIGFPSVRYNSVEAMKENMCIELKQDDYDEKELLGKVLYVV